MRFIEKTVRSEAGDWVKITRDNEKRTFTHAHGYNGQYQAHKIETLPFKWCANWTEAIDRANRFLSM